MKNKKPVRNGTDERTAAEAAAEAAREKADVAEESAATAAAEEAAETGAAETEGRPKKKRRGHGHRFYTAVKIMISFLVLVCTAAGVWAFMRYIYEAASPFRPEKLLPLVPLAAQVILALASLVTLGVSERVPASVQAKLPRKEAKQPAEGETSAADDEDFLKPEVAIPVRIVQDPASYQLEGVYKKNVEEINGKYYMQVAKFDDSVRAYDSLGATDMELCAVCMAGSAKFEEMLNQPRSKTLSSKDFVRYFLSKPNTLVIKKRGALDWTFKYDSKSYGIIREGESSYKVSVKCYPDAAIRLNEVYMALEGSNFPSGPLWYCFNELSNLPPSVCKWLVDTSCQISRFQQIKVDRLKESSDKRQARFGLDLDDILAKYKSGARFVVYPKFAVVFSKGSEADYTTWLTRDTEGLDVSSYTKDYYFKFNDGRDAMSVLCPTKGVSEDVVLAISDAFNKK